MPGNLNNKPVGRCGICGGVVSVPLVFHSVVRPPPRCEKCGAVADESADLPTMPMVPGSGRKTNLGPTGATTDWGIEEALARR